MFQDISGYFRGLHGECVSEFDGGIRVWKRTFRFFMISNYYDSISGNNGDLRRKAERACGGQVPRAAVRHHCQVGVCRAVAAKHTGTKFTKVYLQSIS
jgi:hypothetical protein